jgi:hypothetical protein
MSVNDTLKVINKIASDKSTNNLLTGKIARDRSNDIYDAIIMGDKTIEMPSLKPVNTNEKYKKDDGIFIGVPYGEEGFLRILSKSNIEIPDEKEHRFRSKIITPDGTIYLGCPDESLIKVYSLGGTAGTDISPGPNSLYNICTDGTYLYCSLNTAYFAFRVKPDGTDYQGIIGNSIYYNTYGIAVDPESTHIYTAYDIWGANPGIAKINISTGAITETGLTDEWGSGTVKDICYDANYIYILFIPSEGQPKILKYDFNCNYIGEITPNHYSAQSSEKITTDGVKFYLSDSSTIGIYDLSGTFIRSISENNIQAIAVKNGKIYIVIEEFTGGAT